MQYNHSKIEKKWQKEWEKRKLYQTRDKKKGSKNFYTLVEFPYPSGNLHTGHWYAFSVPDIFVRAKRMQGYNVMFPIGFDAFGLPAENAAIKRKLNPKKWTYGNIDYMRKQLKSMGASFDWSREVITCDPKYYKWTQWIFLQFFKNGLIYQSETLVNWCSKDKTVLANEQVIAGKCERCGHEIEQRTMKQWMLKITDYAEKLLNGLEKLNWPEEIKEAQRNWIGRSEGAEIEFKIITDPTPAPLPKGEGGFGYQTTDPKTWKVLQEQVLKMRKNLTEAENLLWQELRNNSINYHFRRQHIIGKFIVDFVCLEKKLVVEVDGNIHDYQKEADAERTTFLELEGFTVIRFKNEEVINNIESVKTRINHVLEALSFGEGLGGVKVFTTRPDTLFGATYMVLAPEHQLLQDLKSKIKNKKEVEDYIRKTKSKTELERQRGEKDKTGVELRGIKAINPATKEEIPIFIADYVLAHYGTGAIMAVPAHDERDFEFAKKYNLSLREVILAPRGERSNLKRRGAYIGDGTLVNSGKFDGTKSEDAKSVITEFVGGKITSQYRLRDWVLSRQRYWGCPIPIIHCKSCGAVPASEKDLPVELPDIKDYLPTGDGKSPLAKVKKFVETKCPACGVRGERETDTMDTFVDSSWYFLRYCDPKNKKKFADSKKMKLWMPVDRYSGGAEHTTMHLLYSRFWTKAMHDLGFVKFNEPYKARMNRGIILGPDGQKMSKSKGNVVDPDEYVKKLGADTVRMYLAFIGPYAEVGAYPWDPRGILGIKRFLDRVWYFSKNPLFSSRLNPLGVKRNSHLPASSAKIDRVFAGSDADSDSNGFLLKQKLERLLQKTIKKVTEDIDAFHFNTAISQLMILLNEMEKNNVSLEGVKIFLKLLAPFAPHLADELWHQFGNSVSKSIHQEEWPAHDSALVQDETFELVIQINGKVRDKVEAPIGITQKEAETLVISREKIKNILGTNKPCKIIFIPRRLINIVI